MKKATLQVMVITILSKFLGFAGDRIVICLRTSATTDAFLISQTIPKVIFSFISAGIATGFIPMYSRVLNHGKCGQTDTNNLQCFAVTVNYRGPCSNVCSANSQAFRSWIFWRTLGLAVTLTRIGISVFTLPAINMFSGYLRLHSNFIVPVSECTHESGNYKRVICECKTSIYVLAVGSVLASVAQFVYVSPSSKTNYRYELLLI